MVFFLVSNLDDTYVLVQKRVAYTAILDLSK